MEEAGFLNTYSRSGILIPYGFSRVPIIARRVLPVICAHNLYTNRVFFVRRFVQGKLGLDWRRWLTEHLCGLYFGNRAFYALKIGYISSGKTATGAGNEDGTGGGGNCGGAACTAEEEEEEQGGGIDNPVSVVRDCLVLFGLIFVS